MQMINTVTNEIPSFLEETPVKIDKICWKRAYATYLISIEKTPEEGAKDSINLPALLPVLCSLDQKWM